MTKNIWEAAANGDTIEFQRFYLGLEKSAEHPARDINVQDKYNRTPLHYAAESGNLIIVELCLNKKAVLNARDDDGVTPIEVAIGKSHMAVVRRFIAYLEENQEVKSELQRNNPKLYIQLESIRAQAQSAHEDAKDSLNLLQSPPASPNILSESLETQKTQVEEGVRVNLAQSPSPLASFSKFKSVSKAEKDDDSSLQDQPLNGPEKPK